MNESALAASSSSSNAIDSTPISTDFASKVRHAIMIIYVRKVSPKLVKDINAARLEGYAIRGTADYISEPRFDGTGNRGQLVQSDVLFRSRFFLPDGGFVLIDMQRNGINQVDSRWVRGYWSNGYLVGTIGFSAPMAIFHKSLESALCLNRVECYGMLSMRKVNKYASGTIPNNAAYMQSLAQTPRARKLFAIAAKNMNVRFSNGHRLLPVTYLYGVTPLFGSAFARRNVRFVASTKCLHACQRVTSAVSALLRKLVSRRIIHQWRITAPRAFTYQGRVYSTVQDLYCDGRLENQSWPGFVILNNGDFYYNGTIMMQHGITFNEHPFEVESKRYYNAVETTRFNALLDHESLREMIISSNRSFPPLVVGDYHHTDLQISALSYLPCNFVFMVPAKLPGRRPYNVEQRDSELLSFFTSYLKDECEPLDAFEHGLPGLMPDLEEKFGNYPLRNVGLVHFLAQYGEPGQGVNPQDPGLMYRVYINDHGTSELRSTPDNLSPVSIVRDVSINYRRTTGLMCEAVRATREDLLLSLRKQAMSVNALNCSMLRQVFAAGEDLQLSGHVLNMATAYVTGMSSCLPDLRGYLDSVCDLRVRINRDVRNPFMIGGLRDFFNGLPDLVSRSFCATTNERVPGDDYFIYVSIGSRTTAPKTFLILDRGYIPTTRDCLSWRKANIRVIFTRDDFGHFRVAGDPFDDLGCLCTHRSMQHLFKDIDKIVRNSFVRVMNPNSFLVYAPPASGKSTYAKETKKAIDVDEFISWRRNGVYWFNMPQSQLDKFNRETFDHLYREMNNVGGIYLFGYRHFPAHYLAEISQQAYQRNTMARRASSGVQQQFTMSYRAMKNLVAGEKRFEPKSFSGRDFPAVLDAIIEDIRNLPTYTPCRSVNFRPNIRFSPTYLSEPDYPQHSRAEIMITLMLLPEFLGRLSLPFTDDLRQITNDYILINSLYC